MGMRRAFYFAVHSRKDHDRVMPIVEALEQQGIDLWLDTMLQPGENWRKTIFDVLHTAAGMILFISPANFENKLMQHQLDTLIAAKPGFLIPVILEYVPSIDDEIAAHNPVNISGLGPQTAAQEIVKRINSGTTRSGIFPDPAEFEAMAKALVDQLRGTTETSREAPTSVFVVHGHDTDLLNMVEGCLRELKVEPIVLVNIGGAEVSLFQKFLRFSEDVRYAVVLISADDYGAARRQYDAPGVADRSLQFRMRQNVLLELGFFYGYLGWENVFVLYKPPTEVFPNFEMPSDLGGILFDAVDTGGKWKAELRKRLKAAGFIVE